MGAYLFFVCALVALVIWFPRRLKKDKTSRIDQICERWGLPRGRLRKWANSRGGAERRALAAMRQYQSELESLGRADVWAMWRHDPERLERELGKLRLASELAAIERQIAAREK